MQTIWQKRLMRVISNFGISFLTPFSGSGVGQAIYNQTVDVNQMLFTALFSSTIYTFMVVLHEVREASNE